MNEKNILLIEDNEGDVVLMLEAFGAQKAGNHIHVTRDGQEAIMFLSKKEDFKASPTPDVIILDLNLPKMDGKEVLKYIKGNFDLKSIPVVIFTTSSSAKDIKECYDCNANCYVVKPDDFSKFQDAIQTIEHFWATTVKLNRTKTN